MKIRGAQRRFLQMDLSHGGERGSFGSQEKAMLVVRYEASRPRSVWSIDHRLREERVGVVGR